MRRRVQSVLEYVGAAAVVAGIALWSVPLAMIVGGVTLVAAGNLPGRH